MKTSRLIAVRHVQAGKRLIPVHIFRNRGGSVAARCFLSPKDSFILDGPTPEAALSLVRDVLDCALLVRS